MVSPLSPAMEHQRLDVSIPGVAASTYPILIGRGLLGRCGELVPLGRYSQVFVVSDEHVAPHWLELLRRGCGDMPFASVVLPPGETAKDLTHLAMIWEAMQAAGCDRRTLVLDLGGGVVGDMGGFAASTFMRGVDFVQVPTTLLSMVDASVGGKLGINRGGIKNLIGVFQQPQAVLIDLDTLQTLPLRELRSGLAEVIKHGLIRDQTYFSDVCKLATTSGGFGRSEGDHWADLVLRSCQIKADVVQADEREGGVRKILNFGHTAGHAIESLLLSSSSPLLHGEAVGLGMLVEAEISRCLGYLEHREVDAIAAVLEACHLPIRLPMALDASRLMEKMLGDKKNVAGEIRWSLLQSIGEGIYDASADAASIDEAFLRIAPLGEES